MFSTLLQLILVNHDSFDFEDNEKLKKRIEQLTLKFEELKKSFSNDEKIETLLTAQNDVNALETAKKLENILMVGVKIGLELGVCLPEISLI